MEAQQVQLNKITQAIAERIHLKIKQQVNWIKDQDKVVTENILGNSTNTFDLRQNVQALKTGENTLTYLKETFESTVGISYDAYVESIGEKKITTPEEKFLNAIREVVRTEIHPKEAA